MVEKRENLISAASTFEIAPFFFSTANRILYFKKICMQRPGYTHAGFFSFMLNNFFQKGLNLLFLLNDIIFFLKKSNFE